MLERLISAAAGFFLAAVLIVGGIHLIESVLPALVVVGAALGAVAALVWWFRARRDGW